MPATAEDLVSELAQVEGKPQVSVSPLGYRFRNPEMQAAVEDLHHRAAQQGIQLVITSGDRSRADQERLYANRASNPNPVARPGTSLHEQGFAVDLNAFRNGRRIDNAELAPLAQQSGLAWHGPTDPVHFRLSSRAGGNTDATAQARRNVAGKISPAGDLVSELARIEGKQGAPAAAPVANSDAASLVGELARVEGHTLPGPAASTVPAAALPPGTSAPVVRPPARDQGDVDALMSALHGPLPTAAPLAPSAPAPRAPGATFGPPAPPPEVRRLQQQLTQLQQRADHLNAIIRDPNREAMVRLNAYRELHGEPSDWPPTRADVQKPPAPGTINARFLDVKAQLQRAHDYGPQELMTPQEQARIRGESVPPPTQPGQYGPKSLTRQPIPKATTPTTAQEFGRNVQGAVEMVTPPNVAAWLRNPGANGGSSFEAAIVKDAALLASAGILGKFAEGASAGWKLTQKGLAWLRRLPIADAEKAQIVARFSPAKALGASTGAMAFQAGANAIEGRPAQEGLGQAAVIGPAFHALFPGKVGRFEPGDQVHVTRPNGETVPATVTTVHPDGRVGTSATGKLKVPPEKVAHVQPPAPQPQARATAAPVEAPEATLPGQRAEAGASGSPAPAPVSLTRSWTAGSNRAAVTFQDPLQRDLYDLGAKQRYVTRGGQNKTSDRAVGDIEGLAQRTAAALGTDPATAKRLGLDVHDDVRAQMKGIGDGQARKVRNNVPLPQRQAAPAAPAPAPTKAPSSTGLGEIGDAGKAIAENMRAALWEKVQRGDVTEGGQPSSLLQAAKMVRDRGGLQTPEEFTRFAERVQQVRDQTINADPKRSADFQTGMRAAVDEFTPKPGGTAAPEVDFLTRMEQEARQRMQSRRGRLQSGLDPEDLRDWSVIGAVKVARGAVQFADWSRQMTAEFGDAIRPHLETVWNAALAHYHRQVRPQLGETAPSPETVGGPLVRGERVQWNTKAGNPQRGTFLEFNDLGRARILTDSGKFYTGRREEFTRTGEFHANPAALPAAEGAPRYFAGTPQQFFEQALKGDSSDVLHLGSIDAAEAAHLQDATGHDVRRYSHVLDAKHLRHIWQEHGLGFEDNPQNIPLTPDDLARLPEIVRTAEHVEKGGETAQGAPVIVHRKRVNGFYYVAQEVRTRPNELGVVTLYKERAPEGGGGEGAGGAGPRGPSAPSGASARGATARETPTGVPYTSETPEAIPSVSRPSAAVNPGSVDVGGHALPQQDAADVMKMAAVFEDHFHGEGKTVEDLLHEWGEERYGRALRHLENDDIHAGALVRLQETGRMTPEQRAEFEAGNKQVQKEQEAMLLAGKPLLHRAAASGELRQFRDPRTGKVHSYHMLADRTPAELDAIYRMVNRGRWAEREYVTASGTHRLEALIKDARLLPAELYRPDVAASNTAYAQQRQNNLLVPFRRAAEGRSTPAEGYAGSINLDRLDVAPEVKSIIRDTYALRPERIDERRRGVRTNEETAAEARRLIETGVVHPDKLKRAQKGRAYNAEELQALADLHLRLLDDVRAAEAAFRANDSTGNRARLLDASARYQAVHLALQGASAEAGRALQIHRTLKQAYGGDWPERAVRRVFDPESAPTVERVNLGRRQRVTVKPEMPEFGSQNKFFEKPSALAARQRLLAKAGRLSSGIDPTILPDLIEYGGYLVEGGVRQFGTWARRMRADVGHDFTDEQLREVWGHIKGAVRQKAEKVKPEPPTLAERARNVLLKEIGEEALSDAAVEALAKAGDDPVKLAKVLRAQAKTGWAEHLITAWKSGLTSGPSTHVTNFVSTGLMHVLRIPERALAGLIDLPLSKLQGRQREFYVREALPGAAALRVGLRAGVRDSLDVLRHGFNREEAQRLEVPQSELPGGAPNLLNLNLRALGAEDAFHRGVFYHVELSALATREALRSGLKGDALRAKVTELLDNADLQERARQAAAEYTFNASPDEFLKNVLKLRRTLGPAGHLILPFARTPYNVAKLSAEFSPLGFIAGGKRLAAGSPEAARTLSRALTGTLVLTTVASWATEDKITGAAPRDPAARDAFFRSGRRPYSVKIGNRWVSYEALGPLTPVFAAVARWKATRWDRKQSTPPQEFWNAAMELGKAVVDQSPLGNVTALAQALDEPDRFLSSWARNTAAGLIPMSGFVRNVAYALDPKMRQQRDLGETLKARLPGLSRQVPAKLDTLGAEVRREPGGRLAMQKIIGSKESTDPVTVELNRLKVYPSAAPPALTIQDRKLDLSRAERDALQRQQGQLARRMVEQVIRSDGYRRAPDAAKRRVLQTVIHEAHAAANEAFRADAARRRFNELMLRGGR